MAETIGAPVKSAASCGGATDMRALEQVEKWMAVIREIKQEPAKNEVSALVDFDGRRLDHGGPLLGVRP